MKDVSKLWSAGYALGASLENTLVVADDRLLNPEGLRFADEFVRHKALDAIGDLALAGAPLLGAYKSVCGGHKLNHAILCALIADPSAWTVVEAKETRAHRVCAAMPNAGPRFRSIGRPVVAPVNETSPHSLPDCLPAAIIAWRIGRVCDTGSPGAGGVRRPPGDQIRR